MGRGPLLLALSLLAAAAPPVRAGELTAAEIAGDHVRLRAGPGTKHPALARLDRGALVVLEGGEEGRWRRVRLPGGFPCWIHSSLVDRRPDGEAVVNASRVLLRASPGKELLPLETVLDRGEVVTVLGAKGEWLRILPPERTHLFVYGELVRELGPISEYRAALARAARERRRALLEERSPEEERRREEARQKAFREEVVSLGATVLAGKGRSGELRGRLRTISLESNDDLTRGYANALLLLLGKREEAERLRRELEGARGATEEALARMRKELALADGRYREALRKARELGSLRERPFRGIGVIEKRGEGFVLVAGEEVLFWLQSSRFRLGDYVGKKVGVNGRLGRRDPGTGRAPLLVEKLEILLVKPGSR